MKVSQVGKNISNIVYAIGVVLFLCLGGLCLFGSANPVNLEAMLPATWKETAFLWLAIGSIPMLLACMAVYKFNAVKNSAHKARNFVLIFLPGFICGACLLLTIGVVGLGFVNSFLLQ